MTYGIFNLESGNLIETYRSEKRALQLIAEILEDDDNDAESIGLVTFEKGQAVRTLSGEALREAAAAHGSSIPA